MKAALYLRVSTDRQTVENQRAPLERMALARGYEVVEVVEEVESGAKPRPLLDALCERARRGEIDAIVFAALDRLGRSVLDVLGRVEKLDQAGVKLLCLRDGWLEAEGPARQLMLAVMAGCAELERNILRERTRAGVARARAQGKRVGRPPTSPLQLALALQAVANGKSQVEAARLACVSRGALRRALAEKATAGEGSKTPAGRSPALPDH